MSEKPISPLRRRMIEDMTVRNFVEKTRDDYIRHVRTFTAFLGRSPDTAMPEDLRRFQLHQTQTGVRAPSINGSVAALRFFFTVTLDRSEMARHLTFVREPRKIPVILSPEEVARLLEAAPGPKYKAALSAAYAAGLRVSEVVALKVSDIDSERLLLRIEQGKGRKDRFAIQCSIPAAAAPRKDTSGPSPVTTGRGAGRTRLPSPTATLRVAARSTPSSCSSTIAASCNATDMPPTRALPTQHAARRSRSLSAGPTCDAGSSISPRTAPLRSQAKPSSASRRSMRSRRRSGAHCLRASCRAPGAEQAS